MSAEVVRGLCKKSHAVNQMLNGAAPALFIRSGEKSVDNTLRIRGGTAPLMLNVGDPHANSQLYPLTTNVGNIRMFLTRLRK